MQIDFKVIDDRLVMSDTLQKFVSGNTNTYICKFDVTTTLQDKFVWYAVFYTNDGSIYRREIKDGKCYIPDGAIRINRGFSLRIGVYATIIGTENVKRLSTNLLTINIVPGAYCEDAASSVPSHDAWEEMLSRSIPIIGDNDNWFIYDFEKADYVDSGKSSKCDAESMILRSPGGKRFKITVDDDGNLSTKIVEGVSGNG